MNRQRTLNVLPLCMMIALLAAFLFVSPAFAQDEVSPEVVPTEAPVVVLPTEITEAVPAEVVPTETPAEVLQTEVTPAEELSKEAVPEEESPTFEPSLAEALDEAGLVLTDASGEPVTFAERTSEDLIATGDPYFTVGSNLYRFILSGSGYTCASYSDWSYCEESATPIMNALYYMANNGLTPTDRKLYIEPGTYPEDVYVDGTWPGVSGLLAITGTGNSPEQVTIDGHVYITNFQSGFTLQNLSVYNAEDQDFAAIYFDYNKGTIKLTDLKAKATHVDSSGIIIAHNGTVELNRVNSSENGYIGARIWNWGTGGIKITNSVFDLNLQNVVDGIEYFDDEYDQNGNPTGNTLPTYRGMDLWTPGPISLFGVSASGNTGDGSGLSSEGTVTVKDSVFDSNDSTDLVVDWGDGLQFWAKVGILENIQANNNNMRGINPNVSSTFTGKHLHTDENGWQGVHVYACQSVNSKCTISGTGNVTITDSSSSGNGSDGIRIRAKGVVTLTGIYSGDNGEDGIFVENTFSPSAPALNLTDVETGDNQNMGIQLNVKGPVTARDLFIYNNSGDGLNIVSTGTGAITITNASNIFNLTRDNGYYGYYIDTLGPVTVTNFDTHDNGSLGGVISNFDANSAAAVTVNMIGTTDFINGYWNNGSGGLLIQSRGVVTVSRVGITDNNGVGLEINNRPIILTAPGVAVTVSDSYFYRNSDDGLKILSKGLVTLVNINANDNHGYGATIDNWISGATAGVTLNAPTGKGNEFQWNANSGLRIRTSGPVTITNVFANDNGSDDFHAGFGVDIQNDFGAGAVTIKQVGHWDVWEGRAEGNVFSNNYEGGLRIQTRGAANVAFFQASDNGLDGIYIHALAGTGAVTLTGTANYRENLVDNGSQGLVINAKGNITISKIDASRNESNGATLVNHDGIGNVTLTDAYFDRNGENGLHLSTKGTASWKNGSASDNFSSGASIFNQGIGKAVTITNVNYSGNGLTGIYVISKGAVTMSDVESSNNSANGYEAEYGEWWKDNLSVDQVWTFDGLAGEDITVEVTSSHFLPVVSISNPSGSQIGTCSDDDEDGSLTCSITDLGEDGVYQIMIGSLDDVNSGAYEMKLYEGTVPSTWTNMESLANGIHVDNHEGTGAVSISNKANRVVENNAATGVLLISHGAITLTNVISDENGNAGIDIDTSGAVKFTQVSAYSNIGSGASVITPGTFTILASTTDSSWFTRNSSTGLYVKAGGAISISKVVAGENGGYGIDLWSTNASGTAPITLSNVTSHGNSGIGLNILTKGAVTGTTLTVNFNDEYGMYLDQTEALDSSKAIILNLVSASNNYYDGVYVNAMGSITTNTIWAMWNGLSGSGTGVGLVNRNPNSTGSVTMLNSLGYKTNFMIRNADSGVYISSFGTVNISQLESIWNSGDGLDIVNANTTLKPAVTLNNVITRNNHIGIDLESSGVVTINTSWSTNNSEDGIRLLVSNNVNILNTASTMNRFSGIWANNNGIGTLTLKLTGSAWFGNNRADLGYANLARTGNWTIVY
ncbi:MAG: hypothetical protein HGA28_00920 [Anaerolineaceae bacterium]|nr:hypothetical protein [Anaerolineaceae bacterium]